MLSENRPIYRHIAANGVKSLPNIKNIIAVASGKGGVGKSTIAVNLALSLQALGATVGLLDADIYGPSQPHMLGVAGKTQPIIRPDQKIEPIMVHGLQTMSIGYLIDKDVPAVWRGPMVSGALQQMLKNTYWRDLDYLIIDLPPGTGDIQLTLAQKVPVCGAVVVTTPQDIALLDVTKAIEMFTRVKVPVFGVIENMSLHTCTQCGHQEHIFGMGGGEVLAKQFNTKLLGSIPLNKDLRELSDAGKPIVAFDINTPLSQTFIDIAQQVQQQLSRVQRDLTLPLTSIVIEES